MNFSARSHVATGQITFTIEPTKWQAPDVVLHVRPPTKYGKIKSVKVNGEEWKDFQADTVMLGRRSDPAVVVCQF